MITVQTHATTIAAHAASTRKALVQRLRELPPKEATRERVLQGQEALAPLLEQLIAQGVVRSRGDGTLRYDESAMHARAAVNGKIALLVFACVLAVAAGAALTVLLLR